MISLLQHLGPGCTVCAGDNQQQTRFKRETLIFSSLLG